MVTGCVCGPASVLIQHQNMNMNEGVLTVQNILAEYDVLKLGVFRHATSDAQTCKNLYRICDSRLRKRCTSWFSWFCHYLSRRLWVRVGVLLQFLLRVYTCVSAEQHPPPPTLPRARRSHKQQAGRQVERQISRLVSEKRKYITASGYLRRSAG